MKTYDLNEAAEFLKCNAETVRELVADGTIPAGQTGKAYAILEEDLVAYLRKLVREQTQARRARAEGDQAIGKVTPITQPRARRRAKGRRIPPPELPEIPPATSAQ